VSATATEADEYLPGHGDLRYHVTHYDLALAYTVASNHLQAKAGVTLTAEQDTDEIAFDLSGLTVTKVVVDGARGTRYTHRRDRLVVHLAEPLGQGQECHVVVSYHGNPAPLHAVDGEAGWEELRDGVIVAAQPHGAPSWFPCNDRPADKAAYRIQVETETAYTVIANGTLVARHRGASRTTWVYDQPEPMASYLATVQIGRYGVRELADQPVPVSVSRPARLARQADAAVSRLPEMVSTFSRLFGAYPFARYTVVVTDDDLEIPLEAQGLATFGANFASTDWSCERLVAHELAHQWFGNSLTVSAWKDIWLHEGFACYSEWLWSEESGGRTAAQHAATHWARLRKTPRTIVVGDPGPELMFDDRVYKRGALTLHALRLELGDGPFFDMLREWVSRNAFGSVTTAMFIDHAESYAASPLRGLFDRWLFAATLPTLPTT
jgi:aminopeptidase N